MTPPRPGSLLRRLLVAYLLPTLGLMAAFAWLAYREADRRLEASLGQRLIGVAQATAVQLRAQSVAFLTAGDDGSRTAQRLTLKLRQVRERTRVARIVVLDRELRCLGDSSGAMRIGDHHYNAEADRHELQRVFAGGEVSSVLFRGRDGQLYKTGYSPLLEDDKVIAAIGVEGSPEYFQVLARLRNYLVLLGGVVAALVVLITLLVARRITGPLRRLAGEARRIGAGDLEHAISPSTRDEVGLLASTMNEMRQGLFQRDQQMQMMLSGIAHEVRNPLGGIELFTGMLREDLAEDADKLEMVQRIERELAYLKKVVEDFLDYARRRAPELRPVDLARLVEETAEVLAAEAAQREVALTCQPPEPAAVLGDAKQLRGVLVNLTRNALQASPPGSSVELWCLTRDGEAVAQVTDQGSGISEEQQQQIFTPFFTTREKGTGLGLALARKVVEQHEGRIELASAPGQGSTFRVVLPLAPEGLGPPEGAAATGDELLSDGDEGVERHEDSR